MSSRSISNSIADELQSMRPQRRSRAGITWLDVVVGILVAGCLASLAVTALPGLREAARARQCRSNLAQLGTALHAYHDTHCALPPAAFWVAGNANLARFLKERPVEITHQNWFQLVLPLLNEDAMARPFQTDQAVTDPQNAAGRLCRPSIAVCPTDTYNHESNPYIFSRSDGSEARFARGNYAINGGTHWYSDAPGWLACPRPNGVQFVYDLKTRQFQFWGNGIAGFNKCFSLSDLANGLSTLVAIEEVRAGVASLDPRGVWSLGQIGGSVTWAHGANGDDGGPNCPNPGADDLLHGDRLAREFGVEKLVGLGMPVCDHCEQNIQATSRSLHPGCVNVLFLDGSVRTVGDGVDLGLWHVMHSRDTPASILEGLGSAALQGAKSGVASPSSDAAAKLIDPMQTASGQTEFSGSATIKNSIGMEFRFIKPGSFTMGVPDPYYIGPLPYEAPPHEVRITRGFYLGDCEVTQSQFEAVMSYNPSHYRGPSSKQSGPIENWRNLPLENVTWYEAAEFCRRLSALTSEQNAPRHYRLPTEAEWEYACRGGRSEGRPLNPSWIPGDKSGITAGKDWPESEQFLSPAGSFPPNEFGLHDMCGNVHEWCGDWFGKNYYAASPRDDPQGPTTGYLKVIRGWYWIFTGPFCVTNITAEPWRKSPFVGFRVVCVPRPSE
jgi:prepilin-type processing-associated H-X9-DG protein